MLHLELTTRCNAQCPQCDRMDPRSGYKGDHELTVRQLETMFSVEFVQQLDKVFACGTFGDPAAARECLDIFKWFRKHNPKITLGMNTNGGLRDTRFWLCVAELFSQPLDYVVFSIDGMAMTNEVYRRNVHWHRVMQNSESFIRAGGKAHWDMLVFEHNQHHVDHCREHARSMGFTHFRTKVSNRFQDFPEITFLQPPKDYTAPVYDGPVQCHAEQERSLYVAATGDVLPCCFFGAEVFRSEELKDWVQNDPGFTKIVAAWGDKPHSVCTRNCATCNTKTQFGGQFREETAF